MFMFPAHRSVPLATLCLLLVLPPPATAGWFDPGWTYRKAITVPSSGVVGTDQINFPVLINRTDVDWRDVANSGHVGKSNGGDVLFTASDGATQLAHEIEHYDPVSGELVAWVRVDTLSASVDTDLYIYYGNAAAADQWSAGGAWDANYTAVWHMDETTGTLVADATAALVHGTKLSATEPAPVGSGQIDGAQDFDGSNDIVSNGALGSSVAITLEAWVLPRSLPGASNTVVEFGNDSPWFGILSNQSVAFFRGVLGVQSIVKVPLGVLSHVVATHDGVTQRLYVNGAEDLPPIVLNRSNTATGVGIGFNGTDPPFDGVIDEVRISNVVRSGDWIATQYNNHSSPGTFYSVGSEELMELEIVKRAFLPDGTAVPNGVVVPRGTLIDFLLYINNGGGSVTDVSVADVLDTAFVYQAGTLRVRNAVASCADSVCSPAEELAILTDVAAAAASTDTVDGDVVSVSGGTVAAGDGNAANGQLDIAADRVWALLFSVKVQ